MNRGETSWGSFSQSGLNPLLGPPPPKKHWQTFSGQIRHCCDIVVTSISEHLSATASRKGHFTENLFTYHGEAFHSSFYFLHYRAAVSL